MGVRGSWRPFATALLLGGAFTILGAASPGPASPGAPLSWRLVACAPGYPGSTAQAQPTMDSFAALISTAANLRPDDLAAEYHAEEATGVERLRDPSSGLALVPLPFFLKYEAELDLAPLLQAVQEGGHATETWSLVAPAGAVKEPGDLAGWRVAGIAGYAPAFVRAALAGWGALPDDVEIEFTRRVLRTIRAAIRGETVAVLLDRAQVAALPSLPGAEALAIVAESSPMPAVVLVAVGGRIPTPELESIREAMLAVHERADLAEVLGTMRLTRFEAVDREALSAARSAYQAR